MARIEYLSVDTKGRLLYEGPEGIAQFHYNNENPGNVMEVTLPAPGEWEEKTKIPLAQRDAVIDTLAQLLISTMAVDCFPENIGSTLVIKEVPKAKTLNAREILRFLGAGLVLLGIVMLLFKASVSSKNLYYRSGWTTRSISGFGVIFLGLVFYFYEFLEKHGVSLLKSNDKKSKN